MGIEVTLENRFLSVTRSRTLAFGYIEYRYRQPTLATAGLLVFVIGLVYLFTYLSNIVGRRKWLYVLFTFRNR